MKMSVGLQQPGTDSKYLACKRNIKLFYINKSLEEKKKKKEKKIELVRIYKRTMLILTGVINDVTTCNIHISLSETK
jgi:hypothetical protein